MHDFFKKIQLKKNNYQGGVQLKCHWLQVLKGWGCERENKKVNNKKVDRMAHGKFPWIFP